MSLSLRAITALVGLTSAVCLQSVSVYAQSTALIPPENNDISKPIALSAYLQEDWEDGPTTISMLKGGRGTKQLVELVQGRLKLEAEAMVIIDTVTAEGQHDVYAYARNRVRFTSGEGSRTSAWKLIRLQTLGSLTFATREQRQLSSPSSLMTEAINRIDPARREKTETVSLQVSQDSFTPPQLVPSPTSSPLSRRIRVRPRSSQPLQLKSFLSKDTVPEEQVYVLTGGVNVLVEGLYIDLGGKTVQPGVLDLSADRVIIWTQPSDAGSLSQNSDLLQNASARFQVYLEGNILVRQKQNTITATHAFFDANNDQALLLNAELKAYLPQTGGQLRVRAARLRQIAQDKFFARDAWTTTSPYGKPGYRVQSREVTVEPGPISPFTKIDPITGQPKNGPPLWVTALDSQFIIGDTPVFYLPRIRAPAEDPNIPIRRAVVKHDRIFGLQVKTVWNLSKILGEPTPKGMDWDLIADYLSERGPAIGLEGNYDLPTANGRAIGQSTLIYQYDDDVDNLGFDRKTLPTQNNRGAAIWRHKEMLRDGTTVFGELGYLSDRNYLESFHENRYDTDKDVETLLGIRKDAGAWSGTLWGRTELNEFEASTDWLPRADLYGFSQPLFGGAAYWSSHSSVGYADLEPNALPPSPSDPFSPLGLPYFTDASGLVAMTRHQIDAPFFLGAVKINPFAMGEAAFWNEGLIGKDVDRYLFSGGVRAELAATRIMPFVQSDLWRLNGLAHKSETSLEWRFTDASRGLNEIAQYNEIDDNSTERFRGRYTQQIFPGLIPNEFDPRNYAVRTGAGLWVSAPYHELADDQQTIRLVNRNRLQTKVGPAGQERIRDWMLWEAGVTFFPDADRDNFGETVGLLHGNYRWNVNDRTSLLADGVFDFFNNSQNVWSVGVLSQRSTRGSIYLGYRKVEAKNYLDSQTLVASYSYQLSPKWISTGSVAYDVAAGESRGSSLTMSRVGLDWVVHFGFGIDTSKDNVGVAFALEPRFGPPSPTNLSYLLGLNR